MAHVGVERASHALLRYVAHRRRLEPGEAVALARRMLRLLLRKFIIVDSLRAVFYAEEALPLHGLIALNALDELARLVRGDPQLCGLGLGLPAHSHSRSL